MADERPDSRPHSSAWMPRDAFGWIAALLLVGALLVGSYWRFEGLGVAPLFGDEHHSLAATIEDYGTILGMFDQLGTHVPLPLMQRFCQDVFGGSMWSFRLPAIVPGILTLLLFFPLARRWVGGTAAFVATLALAASPIHIFYSRFGRSYALLILLALLLTVCLERAVARDADSEPRRGKWPWRIGALLSAALLPYVHMSSLGFVFGVAVVAFFRPAPGPARARRRAGVCALFVGAGILTTLLSLPVLSEMYQFMTKVPEALKAQPISLLGIPTLLAGSRWFGAASLVLVPVSLFVFIKSRRSAAPWFAGAILGPLVFLLASRPHGMAYAWARYILTSLPFILMLLSWGLVELTRRVTGSGPVGERLAATLGVALVLVLHVLGPRGPGVVDDGPYENIYLRMRPLAAFNEPFPGMPDFYRQLAEMPEDVRIIEAPPLHSRAVLLYRNYYLQHGHRTLTGWAGARVESLLNGPYVWLFDPAFGRAPKADYLILHRDIPTEVADYFGFVYDEVWAPMRNAADDPFMARHEKYFLRRSSPLVVADAANERMRETIGAPVYEDAYISVWKLDGTTQPRRRRRGK